MAYIIWSASVILIMVIFIVTALVGSSKPDAPEDDE